MKSKPSKTALAKIVQAGFDWAETDPSSPCDLLFNPLFLYISYASSCGNPSFE
jgi:hypothetical protein